MLILGVETSCDETGISLVEASGGLKRPCFRVLKNLVASQIKIHAPYGGVVPNLAKREHVKNLPALYKKLLGGFVTKFDVIAVTVGPGLEPCLWEGINFAEMLAKKHGRPIVAVNHMFGHIVSVLLDHKHKSNNNSLPSVKFPAIALLVSGGHTELVLMKNWYDLKIIGETLDDAVGEAFDKVGRLLNLPFPGGPEVSKLADKYKGKSKVELPRPMLNSNNFNFSFSGLKTAVLYAIRDNPKINKAELAREFQNSAIEVLVSKTYKAVDIYKPKTLIVAGGVAANTHLKKEIKTAMKKFPDIRTLTPDSKFTGDNAAMIASAGYFSALKNDFIKPANLKASGRLSLKGESR